MKIRVCLFAILLMTIASAQSNSRISAQEIGFAEDFALAENRDEALKQLIAGTEAYYYYHCLHFQNTGQFELVDAMLPTWVERYGNTRLVQEIKYRQAVLMYNDRPEQALEFIRRELGLNFNHQRQVLNNQPDLSSELDQSLFARDRLFDLAKQQSNNTDPMEDSAIDWLMQTDLDPNRMRHLLSRLARPDYERLPALIVADLARNDERSYGYLNIHRLLTRDQLDECVRLRPALGTDATWVSIYLTKLWPNPDVDWRRDDETYDAYLSDLWAFVSDLPPAFNSLKAHVLYHRLVFDRSNGEYNASLFEDYLRLPRQANYVNPEYLRDNQNRRHVADLNADYRQQTQLPPISNDEPLVRSYLHHFFVEADSYESYAELIRDTYLEAQFAETKIVNGIGDQEAWFELLSPAALQALRDRVDIDFAYTNPDQYSANDAVELELAIKNVENLIVKVFEINTENFYRQQLREISTDIDLDGLVDDNQRQFDYEEPALRRVVRTFEFPELSDPGVYVIDFIGNGKSSRVVVRKGKHRHLVDNTIAGQEFTILNENNEVLTDAVIWLGGREYEAGEDGKVVVPYSTQPSRQPIVISHNGLSSLDYFQHEAEQYSLTAGFYVDRESLIRHQEAQLLIRTQLELNGTPISVRLLEEIKLTITSTDLDGISTTREVPDFEIEDGREAEFSFQVPDRVTQIDFQLTAKVPQASTGQDVSVSQYQSFAIRDIDRQPIVEDLHLVSNQDGYFLELRGKTGEPMAGRAVNLQLKHEDFRFHIPAILKTDDQGRISLGELDGIDVVHATSPSQVSHAFEIPRDEYRYYNTLHGQVGGTIQIPYLGDASEPLREELSLLEVRQGSFIEDRFAALAIENGMIHVSDLAAGDYDLWLKEPNEHIRIRVTEGDDETGYILGEYRQLEQRVSEPFHIANTEFEEDNLIVQTTNVSANSRIHVFATTFTPPYSAFGQLSRVADAEPYAMLAPDGLSLYVAGRKIGDEYQYILDRRYAQRFPGNMLERPSLLLNPWAVRSTETERQDAADGNNFARDSDDAPSSRSRGEDSSREVMMPRDFSNLDFLANSAQVMINLMPDENGQLSIPLELLSGYSEICLVAIDDHGIGSRIVMLEDSERIWRDLRLADGLDPSEHFTQQKQVSVLSEGDALEIEDIGTARFQAYSTLGDAYRLYLTLTSDSTLAEFSFILDWHEKTIEEKNELYSEYACHELNFFISQKDPDFFRDVVQPYLANKKDKTYLDYWLIESDMESFAHPWNHSRLNIVERILLSHRLDEERIATPRHIDDLYALSPTSRDRFNSLFDFAVKGNSLDTGDAFGFQSAQSELQEEYFRKLNDENNTGNSRGPGQSLAEGRNSGRGGRAGGFGGGGGGESGESGAGNYAAPGGGGPPNSPAMEAEMMNGRSLDALDRQSNSNRDRFRQNGESMADDFASDLQLRGQLQQLYQALDTTKEWAENNYYHLPIDQQTAGLIDANRFWQAYVHRDPTTPFYSQYFPEAAGNFSEMMFALSVMDLPNEAPEHDSEITDRSITITAEGPLLAFHEEIQTVQFDANNTPILVSQNFFRNGDRYVVQAGERFDKFVSDEFLTHVPYGCQVVVTNPTSTRQKINVLTQIPEGALPISNAKYTNSYAIDLEPYHTQSIEFYFYFPESGDYQHYPVHVAKDEQLMAFAEAMTFHVVNELTNIDRESWAYVSQFGSKDDVLEFLEANNVLALDLNLIAFRMQDEEYFEQIVALLDGRHAFNPTLWAYGVKHNHVDSIREFLQFNSTFVSLCGLHIDSPLVTIDPVLRNVYQHLEYRPLVNARAHQLGPDRRILNDRFHQQYTSLMHVLSYYPSLNDEALMAVTYYMLLQDRVEEAMGYFDRVNPNTLPSRIQYDYFAAYLDMFSDEPTVARQIADRYAGYSVDRWRNAFQAISTQLDEIDGADAIVIDDENRDQNQTQLADSMPSFEFEVESRMVTLDYENLTEVHVNYYVMDIELLFSRNPFVQQYSGQFAFIRPNVSESISLDEDQGQHSFELPESLHTSNVLVEVTAAGMTKAQAYYSNALDVQVQESYGMLRVTHQESNRPISKTYVKAYAQMKDGTIRFYKDGYTDLRGRFDYASLSTNELDFVERFSILVFSDDHGAIVREAAPPQR